MERKKIPLIIDTDIGDDIDDTWALMLSFACEAFDIKAISVLWNDTEYKAALIAKMLQRIGREDVPVFVSPATPLPQGYRRAQERWLNDFSLSDYSGEIVREQICARMRDIIVKEKERVCIFGLGPNTTLAQLCTRYPEVKANSYVYAMGGAIYGKYWDQDRVIGEYNIGVDAESARTVFACGWDYTLLPLDVCADLRMQGETYRAFLKKDTVFANIIKENYRVWIEDEIYNNRNEYLKASSILYDIAVPWLALFRDCFTVKKSPLYIDEDKITKEGGNNLVAWASGLKEKEKLMRKTVELL